MSNNFIGFKSRAFAIRLLKSLMAGLSLGLAVAGTIFALSKYELIALKPLFAFLIGAAVLIAVGGTVFLLLRSSDRAVARRLDSEFKLHEKVQTMLAFEKEQGAIYELQRADAEAAIASLPKKSLRFKGLWVYIVALLLGAAVFTASFIFSPEKLPPEQPPEAPFEITEIQIAALEELIQYVTASDMESPYKESIALSLTDLLSALRLATLESERDAALSVAIDAIYEQCDSSSSAVEIMNALWDTDIEGVRLLAKALNYYDRTAGKEWDEFAEAFSAFRTSFVHIDTVTENPDESKMASDTAALLLRAGSNISVALTRSGIPSADALYAVILRLASAEEVDEDGTHLYGISALSELAENLGYTAAQKELDMTLAALNTEIFRVLEQHSANTGTAEYAMTRLKELFGCALPAFPRPMLRDSSSEDGAQDGGTDDGGGGPGAIGGGTVYGSDDLVLDPNTDEYVEYGTILERYYELMFGKVEDGDYTAEEKEAMQKYFEILYGGFEDENGE